MDWLPFAFYGALMVAVIMSGVGIWLLLAIDGTS
jgi:hypothetical protein